MSVNRVVITGNLTRDPELRVTTNGTQVINFGVAVNDRRRNHQTGEWEDRPNFIDCVMFGQRAESLSRILCKGFKVAIDGKLRQNTWESEGKRRSRIEVVVDEMDLMSRQGGSKRPGNGANAHMAQMNQERPPEPRWEAPEGDYGEPY